MLMSLSTVSTTRRCIAQETFCEFVRVINVTIIIIIIIEAQTFPGAELFFLPRSGRCCALLSPAAALLGQLMRG